MKKASKQNERRTLTLRRETVAQLDVRELAHVAGAGASTGYPPFCQSTVLPPAPTDR